MVAGSLSALHIDNAIRHVKGSSHRVRSDLSATLFLTPPEDYDGGELIIEDTYGIHKAKLPLGHMVVYPSSSLHRVEPVTRGRRVSSFFWIQSMVRERRPAYSALRSGQRRAVRESRYARKPGGRATDRYLSQPATAVGRGLESVRRVLFWMHLGTGVLLGALVIFFADYGSAAGL